MAEEPLYCITCGVEHLNGSCNHDPQDNGPIRYCHICGNESVVTVCDWCNSAMLKRSEESRLERVKKEE